MLLINCFENGGSGEKTKRCSYALYREWIAEALSIEYKESDHETNLIPSSLEMIDKFMTYAFLLNENYFTVG